MNFGEALKLLKEYRQLYREGWNGIKRGLKMHIVYIEEVYKGSYLLKAHLNMIYDIEKPFVVIGWSASQEDMLADDWSFRE